MATGYTVTPAMQNGTVGIISPPFTFTAIGGNFSHYNSFNVVSSVESDVFSTSANASYSNGLINPADSDPPEFALYVSCLIPGTRTITITNYQDWTDPSPVTLVMVALLTSAVIYEVLGSSPVVDVFVDAE